MNSTRAWRLTVVTLALLAAVGCGGDGKKDGALCSGSSECEHGSCSNGMCFNSSNKCYNDSDCDSGAFCDSDTSWCNRYCTSGCGTHMTCMSRIGVCG